VTNSASLAAWESEYALRVVHSVNELRNFMGLSIPALRDRLEEVGWKVGLDTLNGILSTKKRKSFSVGEIFSFASALRVPPEFILLGLPSAEDLPESPMLPDASVSGALRWLRGASDSVLRGSYLNPLETYARLLADIRRENAIWHLGGEARVRDEPGGSVRTIDYLIDRMRAQLDHWLANMTAGALVPQLPEPPASLRPYLERLEYPDAPIADLLDERTVRVVGEDMDRLEAAQREFERLKAASDGPSTNAAE
jgi:hypothetical protein